MGLNVPEDPRDAAARLYDEAAAELELAAKHRRVAAGDFRERNIDHAVTRAWAAYGHVLKARDRLEAQARQHAERVSTSAGLTYRRDAPAPDAGN